MKAQLVILAIFALIATASAISCPFTSGSATKEHCRLGIEPLERYYKEDITVQVEYGKKEFEPVEDAEIRVEFYDIDGEKVMKKFETNEYGQVIFKSKVVGYHIIKLREGRTCEMEIAVLIYINTTCGDGICAGKENRLLCAEDCGKCGDGVCDYDENLSCLDCVKCGDAICSNSETRANCFKDCIFCGDGFCDYNENRTSCVEDCESGEIDGCCDGEIDGKCDPDCEIDEDQDCEIPEVAPEIEEKPYYELVEGSNEIVVENSTIIQNEEEIKMVLLFIMVGLVAIVGILIIHSVWKKLKKKPEKEAKKEKKAPKKNK